MKPNADRIEKCPCCGIAYGKFRTGLDYFEVYSMYWSDDPDSDKWRYKRRGTILGKWYEIKQGMWANHLETCRPVEQTREAAPIVEY